MYSWLKSNYWIPNISLLVATLLLQLTFRDFILVILNPPCRRLVSMVLVVLDVLCSVPLLRKEPKLLPLMILSLD
ncbi:unnamed protein product [Leptidea sinapis]|uniref:Uncharacterized protein n=1 Tax=Leptidea sinapis TaxID=189913 RepID=A0A5E4Q4R4_9NEOP|nr:unnamed protein product [Leptidea sinapis]